MLTFDWQEDVCNTGSMRTWHHRWHNHHHYIVQRDIAERGRDKEGILQVSRSRWRHLDNQQRLTKYDVAIFEIRQAGFWRPYPTHCEICGCCKWPGMIIAVESMWLMHCCRLSQEVLKMSLLSTWSPNMSKSNWMSAGCIYDGTLPIRLSTMKYHLMSSFCQRPTKSRYAWHWIVCVDVNLTGFVLVRECTQSCVIEPLHGMNSSFTQSGYQHWLWKRKTTYIEHGILLLISMI